MIRFLLRFAVAAFLLLLASCLAVMLDGLHDNLHPADLAVVLGSQVQRDGQPSESLKARLDHAIELYRQGYFKLVLVSGAHGQEGYDEPRVMARYLEAHGIPHDAIFQDNEGYTTWWTARDTAPFLKAHHLTSVLVISQYFHMPRCRLAFAKFGIAPVYTSHAPFWDRRDFHSVPREVIGLIVYYWRGPNDIAPTVSE